MYYLYCNDQLLSLGSDTKKVKKLDLERNSIIASDHIDEMIEIVDYSKAAFIVTQHNKLKLFTFWIYQLKNFTFKEFHTIIYTSECKLLCKFLKLVAQISHGKYTLIVL